MNIEKANESLQSADLCFQNLMYNSTANRAYYAMFQAAIVALTHFGFTPKGEIWSHEGVQATFTLELIRRRKVFPRNMVDNLASALTIRNKGDYQINYVTKQEARKVLTFAHNFVESVTHRSQNGQ